MIRQYKYEILFEKEFDKVNWNWGSVFHGLIMEQIDDEVATKLHQDKINSFSQYCYYDKELNKSFWVINYLDDYSFENINSKLQKNNYFLKNKNIEVGLNLKNEVHTGYIDIITKHFTKDTVNNFINIKARTPICFKEQGQYTAIPSTQFIFSSIIRKWDTFSKEYQLYDEEVFRTICERVKINSFNIASKKFYLEKVSINGFVGDIAFKMSCANEIKNICKVLEEYSIYSGIGIKTSIGMGGVYNEK